MLLKTGFILFVVALVGLMLTLLDRGAHSPKESRGGAITYCTADPSDCSILALEHAASADRFFASLASIR